MWPMRTKHRITVSAPPIIAEAHQPAWASWRTDTGPVPATRRPVENWYYSPSSLVLAVLNLLADQGVPVDPTPTMLGVARISAADLLTALGASSVAAGPRGD